MTYDRRAAPGGLPLDLSRYTTGDDDEVSLSEFREAIAHLEQICRVDYAAALPGKERERWAQIARRFGAELINMTCRRATRADWDRREKVIELSTSLLRKL